MHKTEQYYVDAPSGGKPIKAWIDGVAFEDEARKQLQNISRLPFIHKHLAVMPDVHAGKGSTIGSVIPTVGAIIPAAVGVDIGCGMMAVRTQLTASDLPDELATVRSAIERAVPHGRTAGGGRNDRGAWSDIPQAVGEQWQAMQSDFDTLCGRHPKLARSNHVTHLGTLGTGNHFIELCEDESQQIWVMLHSGSRGVGNRIGSYFIEKAKREMERWLIQLPDRDLAYLPEGSELFEDYMASVKWAQAYARSNREIMMLNTLAAIEQAFGRPLQIQSEAVNCHHNYVAREHHFGKNVWLTRKGAVSARKGELGIIPGSMGARSYIVEGKGNEDSFCSCSHGAGRSMSRTEARRRFTVDDHVRATEGVECRKDADVVDETPAAYKSIEAVMAAQKDLVSIKHTLKQLVCVKG